MCLKIKMFINGMTGISQNIVLTCTKIYMLFCECELNYTFVYLMLTKASFIWSKYSKYKTVICENIITIWNNCFLFEYMLKYNLFLWWKSEFSASLLQSSEMILKWWLLLRKHFLLLSMLKTVVLLHIFVYIHFFSEMFFVTLYAQLTELLSKYHRKYINK